MSPSHASNAPPAWALRLPAGVRRYYWPQPAAASLNTLGRISAIHRAQALGARRQARSLLIGVAAACGVAYALGGVAGLMALPLGLLLLSGLVVMAGAALALFTSLR